MPPAAAFDRQTCVHGRLSGGHQPAGGARIHRPAGPIDGTTMTVADSPANLTVFTEPRGHNGGASHPVLRLLVLVCRGTRTVIDAVFGPATSGETTYAPQLLGSMRQGMIVLADRNFAAAGMIAGIANTGTHVLFRVKGSQVQILSSRRS